MIKFCIYMPEFETAKDFFSDLVDQDNIICYSHIIGNRWLRFLCHLHIGWLDYAPFKRVWNYLAAKPKKKDGSRYCFLYLGTTNCKYALENNYINHLRRVFQGSKHVAYLMDVHAARNCDMQRIKATFDQCYIFDRLEAERLGISYYPLPYSAKDISPLIDEQYESDLAFVGQAKDRYEEIIKVYENVTQRGVVCKLYLIGVEDSKQKYANSIQYGGFIPATEALKYIINTKCVLEMKVGDVTSYSDRVQKAIAYNKKILTNNQQLAENDYYNQEYMQIFEQAENIDTDFIKTQECVDYKYKGEFSPLYFLEYITTNIY